MYWGINSFIVTIINEAPVTIQYPITNRSQISLIFLKIFFCRYWPPFYYHPFSLYKGGCGRSSRRTSPRGRSIYMYQYNYGRLFSSFRADNNWTPQITSGEILFINVICTNNIIFKLHLSGYQRFIARTTVEALYLYQY